MTKNMEIKKWEDYYKSNKDSQEKEIDVAFYARVSTEHEAQINALANQQSWCYDLLRLHTNWRMTELYTDKGITGTLAKRRNGFLQAIEDGKQRKYDLLVVRDVSRFARNCEESLRYAHILKRYGVEIYFCNDGIWSMDADGDLRLGLMSILAQDESRRISEKVLAGQHISRQKGVLYGTGNILGYRLIKGEKSIDNTYEIIEEDAETVKRIFDYYVNGDMGVKKIASTLVSEHRKNASGEIKWDAGKISRILDNRSYSGYITYRKSQCVNFLDHTRVKTDKSEHIYVKGNFPAIVSDEIWQAAQEKKNRNSIIVHDMIRRGKKPAKDRWVKVMKCQCGVSFKRYKWRTNQTGEEVFGYQCTNQVLHRKRSFIEKQGLDGSGYCNVPSVPQWHLEYQLKRILQLAWHNPNDTIEKLISNIEKSYVETDNKSADIGRLTREQKRLETRLKMLTDMRLDGEVDKDTYAEKKTEISVRLADIEKKIGQKDIRNDISKDEEDRDVIFARIREALSKTADTDGKFLDETLVKQLVERVVPHEDGTFKWFLNIGRDPISVFSEDSYTEYCRFEIGFDEVKAYRKRFGNFIRRSQWKDIHVQVYIRV